MAFRRKTPDERLAEAEKAVQQAKARLDREKARVRDAERKAETRRKIIAGAIALEHAKSNPEWGAAFWSILNRAVKKPDQRAALGLDPLTSQEPASTK